MLNVNSSDRYSEDNTSNVDSEGNSISQNSNTVQCSNGEAVYSSQLSCINVAASISDNLVKVLTDGSGKRRLSFDPVVASVDTFYHQTKAIDWEKVTLKMDLHELLDQLVRTISNNVDSFFTVNQNTKERLSQVLQKYMDVSIFELVELIEECGDLRVLDQAILEIEKIIQKNSLHEDPTLLIGHSCADRELFVSAYIILSGLISTLRSSYTDKEDSFIIPTNFLYTGTGHEMYNAAISTQAYTPFHIATEQAYGACISRLFDIQSLIHNESILSGKDRVTFTFLGPGQKEIELVLHYLNIVSNSSFNLGFHNIQMNSVLNSVVQMEKVFDSKFVDKLRLTTNDRFDVVHTDIFNLNSRQLTDDQVEIYVMKGGTSCNPGEAEFLSFLEGIVSSGNYVYFDFQPVDEYTDEDLKLMYSTSAALDFVSHNPMRLLSAFGATDRELKLFRLSVEVDVVSHISEFDYAKTVRHSVDLSQVSTDLLHKIEGHTGVNFQSNSKWIISESTRRDADKFEGLLTSKGFSVDVYKSQDGHVPQVIGMLVTKVS
jgi:hypothetical protein